MNPAENQCYICNTRAQINYGTGDTKLVDCPRCGRYSITYEARVNLKSANKFGDLTVRASGWVNAHQEILLNQEYVESFEQLVMPSVSERALILLKFLSGELPNISSNVTIKKDESDRWLGISYSENFQDIRYLINEYLKSELGLVNTLSQPIGLDISGLYITPKGYSYLHSIKYSNENSKIGFCAMWFCNTVLPIWTNAIEPAIKDAGYDPKRIDSHQHNNRIDEEIIAMLRRSKFVVADFTGQRGGVYFEAGFALGFGLPVIWTCKKSQLRKVHFDTRQYNFVLWEDGKLDEFKIALQNRIEATIGRG